MWFGVIVHGLKQPNRLWLLGEIGGRYEERAAEFAQYMYTGTLLKAIVRFNRSEAK